MILIDFLENVEMYNNDTPAEPLIRKLPCLCPAEIFLIRTNELQDNKENEELPDRLRFMVTRIKYEIEAKIDGHYTTVAEYDSEEEATKVYDEVCNAIERGDKLYSFRRSNDV
jgi:hypothetical protein